MLDKLSVILGGASSAFGNHYLERMGQWTTLGEGTALGGSVTNDVAAAEEVK